MLRAAAERGVFDGIGEYAPDGIRAVVMAGGEGNRLRPLTHVVPKPLIPVGEMSVLEALLRKLSAQGFERVAVTIGYKADLIRSVIGDGARVGLRIEYCREDKPLGTIGALTRVEGLAEDFVVVNADIWTDLHLGEFLAGHVGSGAPITVGSYLRKERSGLGHLTVVRETQRVVGFEEKPVLEAWVSMGVNALKRSVVDLIPGDTFFGFDDLVRRALAGGMRVRCHPFAGLWVDIGSPSDYERLLKDLALKQARQGGPPTGEVAAVAGWWPG